MRKIVMLRGNSGSGKTTVAKKLQLLCGSGTLLIPQDTVRRDMLKVKDRPGTPAEDLMQALVRYGHAHCDVTILEGMLYADYYQALFQTVQASFGSDVHAYYFDVPFAETVRRHSSKPNANEFGESELRSWWRERDLLGFIPETLLAASASAEETAVRIYGDITAHSKPKS